MKITLELPTWEEIETLKGWDQKLFLEFILQASHFTEKKDEATVLHYIDEGHLLLEKEPSKNELLLPLYQEYHPEIYEKLKKMEWRKSTLLDETTTVTENSSNK